MAEFSFDVGFQRAVLRLMMIDDEFCMRSLQFLDAAYFTSQPLGWVFVRLQEHWEQYQTRCTEIPLRHAVRQLSSDKHPIYAGEVESIIACGLVPEADYIRHQLTDFCKRATFADAHQQAAGHFNQEQHDQAYELMAQAQEKIISVDFGQEDRQWFFEELTDRQHERYRKGGGFDATPFFTGIPDLDRRTDGGVHPGEIWVVFAYAKRCKTTWLINQGVNAVRVLARPVLHIVLEGQGRQIAARYDAILGHELYRNVKHGNINPRNYKEMHARYARLKRQLVIRTLNDWDVSVLHIQAELTKLRAMSFKPEMLIVDYMDLLRSRTACESETQHQVNAARDLKRLVNQEDIACWSAWQAQRPKTGALENPDHYLTSSQVADAYAKVRIVDAYGSLNATNEEMAQNKMRVFMEGHRDAAINQMYFIENDLETMRMITRVETAPPSAQPGAQEPSSVPPIPASLFGTN